MNALGRHLMIELFRCNSSLINDLEFLRETLITAANQSGASIIDDLFHQFNPHGISGVVVIQESHFLIHTWPEYNYVAIDIFTCGDKVDVTKAANYIKDKLGAKDIFVFETKRGVLPIKQNYT